MVDNVDISVRKNIEKNGWEEQHWGSVITYNADMTLRAQSRNTRSKHREDFDG